MSNCMFELGMNTCHRGLGSFVCVCVKTLLHCVIPDVLSHLGYANKTENLKSLGVLLADILSLSRLGLDEYTKILFFLSALEYISSMPGT